MWIILLLNLIGSFFRVLVAFVWQWKEDRTGGWHESEGLLQQERSASIHEAPTQLAELSGSPIFKFYCIYFFIFVWQIDYIQNNQSPATSRPETESLYWVLDLLQVSLSPAVNLLLKTHHLYHLVFPNWPMFFKICVNFYFKQIFP